MKGPLLIGSPRARRRRRGAFVAAAIFATSILLSTVATGSFVLAADTGWHAPSTTTEPNGWTNPSNAFASDNKYATATADDAAQGYGGFHFSIPSGSIIDGITVAVDADAFYYWQIEVRLSWNGGTTWTNPQSTPTLPTVESTYLLGGSSDTWGHPWDPTELSDDNFRLEIRGKAGFGPMGVAVNQIQVRVTYHTPTPTPTSTQTGAEASGGPTQTASVEASISPSPSPSPTGGGLPATGTPPVTPPATDTATLAPSRVSTTTLAAVLAGLLVLALVLVALPTQPRRRR